MESNDYTILPKNKTELMLRIQHEWAALQRAIDGLSEAQMSIPDAGGWSIKDLIAHFGFWEARIVTLYGQLVRGEAPAADDLALDELNAQAYARHQSQTLDEVRREERAAYLQLLTIVVNASDDDLLNPQRFAWTQGKPFAEWIVNNTYGHYEEHQADLDA